MLGATLAIRNEITGHIGQGAMGDVYQANDTQTGETVAVKVLARQLSLDENMLERFRREGGGQVGLAGAELENLGVGVRYDVENYP